MKLPRLAPAIAIILMATLTACNGEDRPPQVTAGPTNTPLVTAGPTSTPCPGASPSPTGGVSGTGAPPTGSVSGTGPAPAISTCGAVVEPKPADALQVNVLLKEWAVVASKAEVKTGKIYFLATNDGPSDSHELVVIKTDFSPDQLPVEEARVAEDKVNVIGEIPPLQPMQSGSGTFTLEAGDYVLICNIRELVGFEYESHYRQGMRTTLKVTP